MVIPTKSNNVFLTYVIRIYLYLFLQRSHVFITSNYMNYSSFPVMHKVDKLAIVYKF